MKIYNFLKTLIVLSIFLLSGSAITYITSFSYESLVKKPNVFEAEYKEKVDFNKLLGQELIASSYNNDVTIEVAELIEKEVELEQTVTAIPDEAVVVVETAPVAPKKKVVVEDKKPVVIAKTEEVKMDLYTDSVRGVVIERTDVEIKTDKMIEHYGFDAPEKEELVSVVAIYEELNISGMLASLANDAGYSDSRIVEESFEEPTMEVDALSTALSSNQKTEEYNDDEIIVMDYTDEEPTEYSLDSEQASEAIVASGIAGVAKREISSNVMAALSRSKEEMSNQNRSKMYEDSLDTILAATSSVGSDASDLMAAMTGMKKSNVSTHSEYSSVVEINALDVNIHQANNDKSLNFEFIPEYDKNDFQRDEEGVVVVGANLKDKSGTIRGTIIKNGKLRTKVDVAMTRGQSTLTVPLLDQEQMVKILEEEGLNLGGGFVLVELEESIVEVDMDGQYRGIFFFDQNLKMVKEDEGYHYKLFTGVEPGNRLVSYATTSNEIAQKIIHVVEDEVYFEMGLLDRSTKKEVELYEKNLMGAKSPELNINENFVTYFNRKEPAKKVALNRYEISVPIKANGTRSYIETTHLGETVYVGFDHKDKLEIPSRDFIEKMMTVHNIRSLEGLCVVQLNISEGLKEVRADGETFNGPMNLRVTYLDKDGLFNNEPTEVADKVFLMGDLQGIMNIKVDYLSGSSDYIKTFCSEETYLVEQL